MKTYLLFIFFCVGPLFTGWTQSCYQSFFNQGKTDYEQQRFAEALEQFKSAILCGNLSQTRLQEVTDWQERARNGFFDAIEQARKKEEEARIAAEKAEKIAVRERIAADSARDIAQANRFALMATNNLDENSFNDTNALVLSYSAIQLLEDQPIPSSLKQAFGQASHEFFSQTRNSETSPIYSILPLSDPAAVVLESGEGYIELLSLENMALRNIGRHNTYLSNLQYAPEQKKLLSTAVDGSIKISDLNTFQSVDYPSHTKEVTSAAFAQQNDGFVTVSKDQSGKLWGSNGQLKKQLPAQKGIPFDVEVAPTGQFLVRSSQGEIIVWNADGRQLVELPAPSSYIYEAQLSPDGQFILTASADKMARIWNLEGQEVASLEHFFPVKSAAFSPNGERILTRTKGNAAKVWDQQGNIITELGHQGELTLAEFSSSGKLIITGAKDNTVKVWNTSGKLLFSLPQQAPPVAAYFSPDEQLILTTTADGDSKLWDQAGHLLRTIPLEGEVTVPSVFSADGRYIISVTGDQEVKVSPIPAYAKELIEEQGPISRSSISEVEKNFDIELQKYWE